MNLVTKLKLAKHFIHWRLTWDKRDTHYAYTLPDNPKFMGPRDAVRQCIKDGDVLGITGLGANMRPSILYWAMRELFQETGKPENLTIIAPGGFGGRGKVPGTPEEIGLEGLVTRFFSGHMETFKSMLRLGDKGLAELQCIPQGTFILLLAAMADGAADFATEAGVGTVIDPRCGRGTPVLGDYPQYVEAADHELRFHCPTLDVTLFNAPAADKKGNIYVRRCAMLGESHEMARLAKQNNGRVIVNVGNVVDEGYSEIFLPADMVDAVVYYPKTEQTGSVYHRKPWFMFTTESQTPLEEGVAQVRFINRLIGVTPKRSEVDNVTARLAASVFAEYMHKDALVNFGVGLPEEVSRLLLETGVFHDITGFTESGVFGGVAAPGVFFGAGVNPKEIVSSAEAFRRMYDHLDATVLGFLQVDSQGNINVSKRGEGAINYVGPGGFIDITTCADHVFFIGTWMANAGMEIVDGKLKITKPGPIKFVEQVDEVTFNGAEALRRGQKVFYITNVGAFKLTERGVELVRVMPGIDIEKDIIEPCAMKIVLPDDGQVPEVDPRTISGKNYKLSLEMKPRTDAPA